MNIINLTRWYPNLLTYLFVGGGALASSPESGDPTAVSEVVSETISWSWTDVEFLYLLCFLMLYVSMECKFLEYKK